MTTVTPEDAFALALIAQKPDENKDLVDGLSEQAKPIGNALANPGTPAEDPLVAEAAQRLREWAAGRKKK